MLSSIASEVKYKTIYGKGRPGMSDCVAEVSDHSHLKILISQKMLQILAIALAQAKAG